MDPNKLWIPDETYREFDETYRKFDVMSTLATLDYKKISTSCNGRVSIPDAMHLEVECSLMLAAIVSA